MSLYTLEALDELKSRPKAQPGEKPAAPAAEVWIPAAQFDHVAIDETALEEFALIPQVVEAQQYAGVCGARRIVLRNEGGKESGKCWEIFEGRRRVPQFASPHLGHAQRGAVEMFGECEEWEVLK